MPRPLPLEKTLLTSRLMADTFGTVSTCVGMGSTCCGLGLVPQLGANVVEVQDLQEVHVKGSEVAGDLEVDRRG
jgi:hypothetical protein